ncbi:transmembrane protein 220-like isoform X2 [Tachypleus tridentatus]|uniref:transmembrane protein 220-like isoform X2 n=1 Tax=Tachypleus tridentatus TaxID=6853 RepID=UPI003FD5750B
MEEADWNKMSAKAPICKTSHRICGSTNVVLWRCVNLLISFFFFLATCVQVNDPDPVLWMVVYAVPSMLTLLIAIRPVITGNLMWRIVCFLHFVACLGFLLYLLVLFARVIDPSGQGFNPLKYEEGREFCGVVILVVWLRLCGEITVESSEKHCTQNYTLLTFAIIYSIFPLLLWALCYVDELQMFVGVCRGMFSD